MEHVPQQENILHAASAQAHHAGFFERVQRVPLLQHMHDLKTVKTVSTMLGV